MPGLVQPLLEPVAHELVDRIESRGEADLVADFTKRYPFKIILRLLGLPPAAEDDVSRWALGMLDIQQHYEDAVRCSQEFVAFVQPVIEQRRTNPADDLISQLAAAEVDGERLTDEEILNFLKLLFPAGADTTYLGLGNTLLGLLTHPDELAFVAADVDSEARWAAEEGLRWNAPVAILPRHNPRDVKWRGTGIPADTPLLFAITAANRDPAMFDDPDRFDVGRRATATMAFGFGTHFCLGAHLAQRRDGGLTACAAATTPAAAPRRRRRRQDRGVVRAAAAGPEPPARAVRLSRRVRRPSRGCARRRPIRGR